VNIDGATIFPLIGEDGRSPDPPDPVYQQVPHGAPAADFSSSELMYLPRNVRAHRLYGTSPVEQIALTVNIALRREVATLEYYRAGSIPLLPGLDDRAFFAKLPDGAFVTYRPAGAAGPKTPDTTATVEVNDPTINPMNGSEVLKLKFPKRGE
jgi:hypothetical protein